MTNVYTEIKQIKLCNQCIQVQAVVEVSTPKEMIETKANVKSAELLFTKRQKFEDVLEVVVPPKKIKRNSAK